MTPNAQPSGAKPDIAVPALLLVVSGALTTLISLISFLQSVGRDTTTELAETLEQLSRALRPLDIPDSAWKPWVMLFSGPVGTALGVVSLVLAVLMTVGAWQMRQFRSYTLAVIACVIALIPCGSMCCCVTMPAGAWGLVLLLRAEVKTAFT